MSNTRIITIIVASIGGVLLVLFVGLWIAFKIGSVQDKKKQQEGAAIASAVKADEDDRARRQREQFERDHASSDTTPTATTTTRATVTAPSPTLTAPTATTTADPKAHICPMAAERAIKRMTSCGLNTEGFTPAGMCKTMTYDQLSFAASRSCASNSGQPVREVTSRRLYVAICGWFLGASFEGPRGSRPGPVPASSFPFVRFCFEAVKPPSVFGSWSRRAARGRAPWRPGA